MARVVRQPEQLRYTAKGEVIYLAAALGAVQQPLPQRPSTYTTTCSRHRAPRQGKVVATGEIGRTPKIIVWDSDNLDSLAVLSFHKRVPCCVPGRRRLPRSVGLDDDHSIAVYVSRNMPATARAASRRSMACGSAKIWTPW